MTDAGTCSVVELRQYTLTPGSTTAFVDLFEEHLFIPQEAVGMRLLGLFTRPDDDSKFVWLRGFQTRASRKRALQAFYYGPIWKQYRDRANAMMLDSDDVHLLRPLPGSLRIEDLVGAPSHSQEPARFELTVTPPDRRSAYTMGASLETDPIANDFPQLPVHDNAVRVTLRRASDDEPTRPGTLLLTPTRRSRLR